MEDAINVHYFWKFLIPIIKLQLFDEDEDKENQTHETVEINGRTYSARHLLFDYYFIY